MTPQQSEAIIAVLLYRLEGQAVIRDPDLAAVNGKRLVAYNIENDTAFKIVLEDAPDKPKIQLVPDEADATDEAE